MANTKLVELMRNYKLRKDCTIDLIESSISIVNSVTDSMLVFMNCERIKISSASTSSELGSYDIDIFSCCLKNRSKQNRFNALKKMEYEEGCHNDLLNGIVGNIKRSLISPSADCNSNNLTVTKENMFLCSTDSIQDCPDFLQDNSEYQWFLDYGYKYNNSHHQSILSLSKSQDLIYYDDMARNIDANLAEVDMDDFNREDIHSALSSLPNMQIATKDHSGTFLKLTFLLKITTVPILECIFGDFSKGVEEREMFASVTGSMMVKFDFDSFISPRSISEEEQVNTSICKSQLLFSPVRESHLPNSNLSVDSLDLSENDINLMVTCQSNKNNYTIAFEESIVMASDDSESREGYTSGGSKFEGNRTDIELQNREGYDNKCIILNSRNSLATSDLTFTTWSKIKENPTENLHLRRHPSGNNNTTIDGSHCSNRDTVSNSFKSLSLPNLYRSKQKRNSGMSLSVNLNSEISRKFSLSNDSQYAKLYDIQSKNINQSTTSSSKNPAHNFSLVKLFIKQKSASHDGMYNYAAEYIVNNDNCDNRKNSQKWANARNNEINKIITDNGCVNNLEKKLNSTGINTDESGNIKIVDTKNLKHITSVSENSVPKNTLSDHDDKKKDHNGYYSDESTQENGSNTESAENLPCHCVNTPVIGNKKLTEKSIQTSKVSNEDTQKKPLRVPVYILYPNYSLPNLEFLKQKHYVQNIDFSKVFLRPQKFQMPESLTATPKSSIKPCAKRPLSVNDIESLKKTGFKHVKDWESLTFLLPKEYTQFLKEIPEIVAQLKDVKNEKEEVVPLFCLSPPQNRRVRKRPNSCDVNISNDSKSSNFSSITTQPSSGYRGSSTMLNSNASHNTNSPRNPSFTYKYDTNSESGSSRRSGCFSHNKNHSINSDDSHENYPVRPPIPKSILRNNSLDSQQFTCKTQKEYANKRYSMVELTDKNLVRQEKNTKRRSLHSSKSPQCVNKEHRGFVDNQADSKKFSKNPEFYENSNKSNLENDMKRLEELLEISAVFGESVESFSETDMIRLRSQVSKFLTMQKNLEKVSETLQTVDEGKSNEVSSKRSENEESHSLGVKQLQTPHNTPEHKKQANNRNAEVNALLTKDYLNPCKCGGKIHEFEDRNCKFNPENLGGLKKTVSFAEKISFAVNEHEICKENAFSNFLADDQKNNQGMAKRPVDLPICEESVECSFVSFSQNSPELLHKRELISDVSNAVQKIFKLCQETKEDPANLCLHHLCPCLYAVLSDGLKEEIDTPFGPIRNSVWSVIEASSQQGPMTQTLNELVQRLNREDIFAEGLIKFNAFIFGLLNARALSAWFSYLRTRDSMLRKYYNSGLLLMSNTAGAPVRALVDQLINIIEPLCSLQFNLDILYQTKLLHCSLQNLNSLLEEPSNNDFLTPTKQFMLLKLVQSIQNSLSQSGEGKRNKHILEDIEQKTIDPPVNHLLEKNKNMRARRSGSKTRPRSGCDSAVAGLETTDVAGIMKKRWSGVNLNSKLVEAFDRLVDDSESDYTDSLDLAAPRKEQEIFSSPKIIRKEKIKNSHTEDLEADKADMCTKEQKKNILLNLNKKSNSKTEDCKTNLEKKEFLGNFPLKVQTCGQKFKRLQQKWERLEKSGRSPSDSDSDDQSPLFERTLLHKEKVSCTKNSKPEKPNCDSTMPSPTSKTSKIPRLVTSPMSTTPSIKTKGNVPKLVSPICSNESNQKTGKLSYALRGNCSEERIPSSGGNRFNKADDKTEHVLKTNSGKNQSAYSVNLSQKRCTPAKKSELISRRTVSTSLNRKPTAKKLHEAQRTVRTLTHRLPSDSGHLSFNEGERLKVILEVDEAWLLCCRGNRKGLVPKSLVISDVEEKF